MWIALLGTAASAAIPFAGVEWRPLSRQDLVWVDESRTSGLGVGEFDGTVHPAVAAYGGAWLGDRFALSGGLGIARLQNTTEVQEIVRQRHWGVVRPSIDTRFALAERRDRRALPWVLAGVHGDIPSARDVSDGYTRKEQKAADETVKTERARLAGFGARLGLGATYPVTPGLSLGAQYAVQWQRAVFQADDLSAVTQWLSSGASLLLVFEWPRAQERP